MFSHRLRCSLYSLLLLPLLVVCAQGHPTNGHLCTEMADPVRCFDSEGFCEWVDARCLYRCDIHDTREDCEQIKLGCVWQFNQCEAAPIQDDATVIVIDSPSDASTTLDGPAVVPDREPDTESQSITTEPLTPSQPHTNATDCRQGSNTPMPFFLYGLCLCFWRSKKCL